MVVVVIQIDNDCLAWPEKRSYGNDYCLWIGGIDAMEEDERLVCGH